MPAYGREMRKQRRTVLEVSQPRPNVLVSHFRPRFDSRGRESPESFPFSVHPLADVGIAVRIVHHPVAVRKGRASMVVLALSFVDVSLSVAAGRHETYIQHTVSMPGVNERPNERTDRV